MEWVERGINNSLFLAPTLCEGRGRRILPVPGCPGLPRAVVCYVTTPFFCTLRIVKFRGNKSPWMAACITDGWLADRACVRVWYMRACVLYHTVNVHIFLPCACRRQHARLAQRSCSTDAEAACATTDVASRAVGCQPGSYALGCVTLSAGSSLPRAEYRRGSGAGLIAGSGMSRT